MIILWGMPLREGAVDTAAASSQEAGRGLIALVLFELEGELTALALLEAQVTFPRCSGNVSSRCRALLTLEA